MDGSSLTVASGVRGKREAPALPGFKVFWCGGPGKRLPPTSRRSAVRTAEAITHFGDQLKAERQRRDLSLEALCAETKINPRYVTALEECLYGELPGGVFRRGVVRAYVRAVGLDETDWLSRFDQSFAQWAQTHGAQAEPAAEAWEEFAENVRRNRAGAGTGNGMRWLGVLLMLAALAVAGWAVWHFALHDRLPR